MSDQPADLGGRAAELQAMFDSSFARARNFDDSPTEDFLAIRLGAEPCAIRLAEITGLYADKPITRVPGRVAALLGIASFRGVILPVYDLAMLVGYPPSAAPRWLVVAASVPVALAFDGFDQHLRIAHEDIVSQEAGHPARGHVRGRVRAGARAWPVVELAAAMATIINHPPQAGFSKEQET